MSDTGGSDWQWRPCPGALHQPLRAAGKPAKVALVAQMRKLAELANLLLKNPQLVIAQ